MSEVIQVERQVITPLERLSQISLINLFCGLFFLFFSSSKMIYESDECIYLRQTSFDYGIIQLIQGFICIITMCSCVNKSHAQQSKAVDFFQIFSILIGVLYFFLLLLAINKGERCGTLHTFVLIYLILTLLGGLCIFAFLCCFLCMIAASEGQQLQRQNGLQ